MTTTTTTPSASSEPLTLVLLRGAALLVLTLIFTLIFGLLLLSLSPTLGVAFQALVSVSADEHRLAGWLTVAFIVAVPLALLYLAWRLKLKSWWWIGGGFLLVAPVLAYLAADDPVVRRPLTAAELAPAFPGAEQSYAVIMRYGKRQPLAKAFKEPSKATFTFVGKFEKKPEWSAALVEQRAAIEAQWNELAPVWAWWNELNAFDRIGDLTPSRQDAEIPAFQPFRTISQFAMAKAGLLALDGRGDDAVATLLPVLEVGRKMQVNSRTLVRSMIGVVMHRMAVQTAAFVLETTPVSAEARARLARALQGGGGGEAGARRLVAIEYFFWTGGAYDLSLGTMLASQTGHSSLRWPLDLVSPFLYNRNRTANLAGEFYAELQDLAGRRELHRLETYTNAFFVNPARPGFKNHFGALLAFQAIPTYSKVLESYWRLEDERAALLARLDKTAATRATPRIAARR